MKLKTLVIVSAFALVLGATGVSAFTTASLERDVSVSVTSDSAGVVGLTPGEGTELDSSELVINAEDESLNVDGEFVFGDNTDPQTSNAFVVTNNDDTAHNFTFTHNGPGSVTYTVHDGNGNSQTATNGGSTTFNDVAAGDSLYVVVEVSTPDSPTTESGSLTIDAE